jgi:gamma-glutamylcysteine synthetase
MLRTCTAGHPIGLEADMVKNSVSPALQPVAVALFANSPLSKALWPPQPSQPV